MLAITDFGTVSTGPDGTEVYALWTQLHAWAHRPGTVWPCSDLAMLDEISVSFDAGGDLVDMRTVDVDRPGAEVDLMADELNAWTSDVLREAGLVNCPSCRRPCRIGAHDSAHCGACFLSFRANDPQSSLPTR